MRISSTHTKLLPSCSLADLAWIPQDAVLHLQRASDFLSTSLSVAVCALPVIGRLAWHVMAVSNDACTTGLAPRAGFWIQDSSCSCRSRLPFLRTKQARASELTTSIILDVPFPFTECRHSHPKTTLDMLS